MCKIIHFPILGSKMIKAKSYKSVDRKAVMLESCKTILAKVEPRTEWECSVKDLEFLNELFVANDWVMQIKNFILVNGNPFIIVLLLTKQQLEAVQF